MNGRDRGSATVELAIGLSSLMVFLFAGLTAVKAVSIQQQCYGAARDAALARARGGTPDTNHLPAHATLSVEVDGDVVRATVSAPVLSFGVLSRFTVSGSAAAALEPGEGEVAAAPARIEGPGGAQ